MKKKYSVDDILREFDYKYKLSDYVSKFITIIPRGNTYVAKCPFHNEKTPSLNINDEKGLYYCFGCKEGGNVLNFISKFNNVSFGESLKTLSSFLGIELTENSHIHSHENSRMYEILEKANLLFQENLGKSKYAFEYLRDRVSKESIENFKIGFCPEEKTLIDYLTLNNFTTTEINNSGLLIKKSSNNVFGRFKNRITFPIHNFKNKVVGFGGRTIVKSKIKYINSPESEIFKKGEILYGFKENYEEIKKTRNIILVEGYLDVIALYQKKIKVSVATLGTTLSDIQIRKMWSFVDVPYICFDGDLAGVDSSHKVALKIIKYLSPGKTFKFINLPSEHDPDSFINKNTNDAFENLKQNATNLSELIWRIIFNSVSNYTPEAAALLDQKILEITNLIQNKIVSREYFKFLKQKKEEIFWKKNSIKTSYYEKSEKQEVKKFLNENILIMFMLFETSITKEFLEEISSIKLKQLSIEELKHILLEEVVVSENEQSFEKCLNLINKKQPSFVDELKLLHKTHLVDLDQTKKRIFFLELLKNLRLPSVESEREFLKEQILSCSDKEKLVKLIKRHDDITNEIRKIRNKTLE